MACRRFFPEPLRRGPAGMNWVVGANLCVTYLQNVIFFSVRNTSGAENILVWMERTTTRQNKSTCT